MCAITREAWRSGVWKPEDSSSRRGIGGRNSTSSHYSRGLRLVKPENNPSASRYCRDPSPKSNISIRSETKTKFDRRCCCPCCSPGWVPPHALSLDPPELDRLSNQDQRQVAAQLRTPPLATPVTCDSVPRNPVAGVPSTLTSTAAFDMAVARLWLQMSHPPSTRSFGCTVGSMFRRGTYTALPAASFPRRTVEAMHMEPQ